MNESHFVGVSIRAWIALVVVCSFCVVCVYAKQIEMLERATILVLGFYFGQKQVGNHEKPSV